MSDKKKTIFFTVEGDPVEKGRPRKGKFGFYTPKKTKDAEDRFKVLSMRHAPPSPLEGAIKLTLVFNRKIPGYFSKKKTLQCEANQILPVTKPDLDNYIKLPCDAMNGLFWKDDNQVVSIMASKAYSKKPRTYVIIEEI